ncbi:hypothetical protein GNI_011380 [Gregarina niphandrodes]|uniref:Uncharacterized protein n=1 Tax=Gregarina niphandrodes TaxID=110365 RepID=A0A023BD13_GRENI|nr:hypothetical protein GNI_011380 [Gregarina niphandrodes]EZG85831.1 hypothetical protein GNI_011380 [Gregarina niphandrodes]|eukprot:XP_011128808.1 hypothetical protein GNI_011380 [Gregarina niphandrodes]
MADSPAHKVTLSAIWGRPRDKAIKEPVEDHVAKSGQDDKENRIMGGQVNSAKQSANVSANVPANVPAKQHADENKTECEGTGCEGTGYEGTGYEGTEYEGTEYEGTEGDAGIEGGQETEGGDGTDGHRTDGHDRKGHDRKGHDRRTRGYEEEEESQLTLRRFMVPKAVVEGSRRVLQRKRSILPHDLSERWSTSRSAPSLAKSESESEFVTPVPMKRRATIGLGEWSTPVVTPEPSTLGRKRAFRDLSTFQDLSTLQDHVKRWRLASRK